MLQAVAENVESDENHFVPQILSLFSNIQYSGHSSVVNMALETLGAYAEWLSSHPVYLGHVLPVLLFGLSNPEAAPAATMALKVCHILVGKLHVTFGAADFISFDL